MVDRRGGVRMSRTEKIREREALTIEQKRVKQAVA